MTVSFEAVPHSPSCGVAQPQSSMKESHPAKLHLQEVAPTGTASSTSNKNTSLQLLLLLHATVGDAALRRRNECSCTARARCAVRPPLERPPHGKVADKVARSHAPQRRPSVAAFARGDLSHPYPVGSEIP